MKTISLICTVHEEIGFASTSSLCSILERLRPEVIFFEAPADAYNEFIVTGTRGNLESTAVRRYRENRTVEVVPVDLPTPDARFFERHQDLMERVGGRITGFQRLMAWYKNAIIDLGFRFLNTDNCSKMLSDIDMEIRATLKILNEQELNEFFELWESTNGRREDEMLKNIRLYCEEHSFERAVFLVGAAHRKAIIEKSRAMFSESDSGIRWDFSCLI